MRLDISVWRSSLCKVFEDILGHVSRCFSAPVRWFFPRWPQDIGAPPGFPFPRALGSSLRVRAEDSSPAHLAQGSEHRAQAPRDTPR